MKRLLVLAALAAVACAQVDPDTYKPAGSTYARSDGLFTDSSGNLHFIVNGSTVGNITSAGNLTMSGTTSSTGDMTLAGGAGALTFSAASSSVIVPDDSAAGLDIGASGATSMFRFVTTNDGEYVLFGNGTARGSGTITGVTTLDASDCGRPQFVTAGIDGASITLPALSAVPAGCVYQFHYVGADGGALLDISPNAADGIEGGCTLAASVVNFSGADDADIGLTKATIQQGDTISLVAGNADDWYAYAIQGICANN